jgi:hypothetical protein
MHVSERGDFVMTDKEYALRIYNLVFNAEDDKGNANIEGILEAIGALSESDRMALEDRYRYDKLYRRIGIDLGGLKPYQASRVVQDVVLKLSHPLILQKMSNSLIEQGRDIWPHKSEINKPVQNNPLSFETSVFEIGLAARPANALARDGKHTVESILKIETYKELFAISKLGVKLCGDIIARMRHLGYTGWADKITPSKRVRRK